MVLVIDNYDSFTYNIVQYLMQIGEEVQVVRNDAVDVEKILETEFDQLVISPGPGTPDKAGVSLELITKLAGKKPILGVCLGHQAIAQAFGARIIRAKRVMHGKGDLVTHDGKTIFQGLPNPLKVIRYHSLAIDESTLTSDFEITARSSDGEIMGIRHKKFRIEGVQFHPESIGTEEGIKILTNFFGGVREVFHVKAILKKAALRQDLTRSEAEYMAEMISVGEVSPSQIGAFLTALSMKGETAEEIAAFARVFRQKATPVSLDPDIACIDTCGTGGDSSGTFNISTTAAFVACGAGVKVAKHGNRSITSKSGSADVLEALGITIDLPPEKSASAIKECGISFLFAQKYHPAFKHIMGPRKDLAFRTMFNVLGPLLNPAGAKRQVMGVFDGALTEKIAEVLNLLGAERALVVHGNDGLDEITLNGTTRITELKDSWVRTYDFDPRAYGFDYCTHSDMKGGDAVDNASITRRILEGEKGPKRDVVVLNAAASIITAGLADNFESAIILAQKSIDSGAARASFEGLKTFCKNIKRDWE